MLAPMRTAPRAALRAALILLALLLAACAGRQGPDLANVYARAAQNPSQPPVVFIPGLMGSTLVDPASGQEVWPGPLSRLAFGDYASLARLGPNGGEAGELQPGGVILELGGVDVYGRLLQALEQAGRYRRGRVGEPPGLEDRRRYYVLAYDWRLPNIVAVRQLHALIDRIREDYGDPALKVDIIAHSNGGLIANYYLRHGPNDVLGAPQAPLWDEGGARVRRVAMLGTPNLGSVASLQRLHQGFRFNVRTVPVEALATFPTVFETLPHPHTQVVFDREGNTLPIDLFDPTLWRDNQWSVYSPAVEARVRAGWGEKGEPEAVVATLRASFERHLRRARRFNQALAIPLPPGTVQMAAFGGDCGKTRAGVVLEVVDGRAVLAFSPGEVRQPVKGVDYAGLMEAAGDGLVTRESQDAGQHGFVPLQQTFFLCESHGRLLANRYFQNNLLNFLLAPER